MENKTTIKRLILLISVFIIGIVFLIILNIVFTNLTAKLDDKAENLKAKIQISELIVDDLHKIRSEFYQLSVTSTNIKTRQFLRKKIKEKIEFIKSALFVFEKGGTLKKEIRLNIVGHSKTHIIINYKKEDNKNFSLEAIDLRPKLVQLTEMIDKVEKLLINRDFYKIADNFEQYLENEKELNRFYKTTPPFFTRIIENSSRSLYEGNLKLKSLEKEIQEEKNYYLKLELILIFLIIFIVIYLGFVIAKQINQNSQKMLKQEIFTRGILDAQTNIVIVSDGEKMIDANKALIDFFDGYKNFEDFEKKHKCICDFFENIQMENFLTGRYVDDKLWFEYLLENPNTDYKVAMRNSNELRYFKLKAVKTSLDKKDSIIIVSLSDITAEFTGQRRLKNLNDNLESIVEEKTRKLKELNDSLEIKIDNEIHNSREKDKRLIQQSRYAALGEMIGNIAHQWRQPLSAISSTASSENLKIELGIATNKEIKTSFDKIMNYTQFLTKTIDDFRTFFKKDKEKIEFNVIDILNNSISLIEGSYKSNEIEILKAIEKDTFLVNGFPSELSQVFLNILANAKDSLINDNINPKFVAIEIYGNGDFVSINIRDNGKGIKKDIIEKVFDPYFTTKHKSQGTGIGLYMTKEIIEKHMEGSISANNCNFTLEDINFTGACFTINLPKSS